VRVHVCVRHRDKFLIDQREWDTTHTHIHTCLGKQTWTQSPTQRHRPINTDIDTDTDTDTDTDLQRDKDTDTHNDREDEGLGGRRGGGGRKRVGALSDLLFDALHHQRAKSVSKFFKIFVVRLGRHPRTPFQVLRKRISRALVGRYTISPWNT
jgi:hypothetical protein